MIPWRFIIFALAVALLVYLQFYLAHRQWRRLKGEQTTEIDLDYIRREDCLARFFRNKVEEWLKLPSVEDGVMGGRSIRKGREQIRVTGLLSTGAGEVSDDILVVQGDFSCGASCVFAREIYARGSARIGEGSRLQSLAADKDVVLEPGVSVTRWVDSAGNMQLGNACQVGTRVTSQKAVRLGLDAQAGSVFAPQVSTYDWDGRQEVEGLQEAGQLLEIQPPEDSAVPPESLRQASLEPEKLVKVSEYCWSYRGDFKPTLPMAVKTKLVVKGQCHLPGGSFVADDLKAEGSLFIGPRSVCEGNLVAGKDIYLAPQCRFQGVIHAGGSILLSQGVRGIGDKDPVAVYAVESVNLERNVAVRGKLASASYVVVIRDTATDWRRKRGLDGV